MKFLAQMIVGEPSLLFMCSVITAGVGWTLKKVLDIDGRLNRIEERCTFHRKHTP